ncbi:MAG TPA: methionine biosynthesis protein MetW [Acidimicrobiales bacterium]|nr:methionine biosynthesis protein MetW [Acidimicrobiales bacterium]
MAGNAMGRLRAPGYSHRVPPAPPSTPSVAPIEPDPPVDPVDPDPAARARYLDEVMAEIDAEVRRRRASGDLPAGLERELDELFLEFSPVGLHGRARLRETLALVDGSAYVDTAVPVASQKAVGTYVKRLIRKAMGWYIGFIVHQIVKFAWSVSRMFHVVVDHVEDLEAAVESQRAPELPASAVPLADPGSSWWSGAAVDALAGAGGRVLHAECGDGTLLDALIAGGVDAYGVDPTESVIEPAIDRGLDVRAESVLGHLEVVAEEALSGMVLSGSIQWLRPNERDRLVSLVTSRLTLDGVLVLNSATPESWTAGSSHLINDLAPGRPLHAETWSHLLTQRGFRPTALLYGGEDRRLGQVAPSNTDADAINAAIDVVNTLLLGPGEYLLVAVRER